jgi:Ca2+-binding EF-hand superfamily protein
MKENSIGQRAALLVAILTMGTTTTALAQRPGHNPMTVMDLNKNGSVSLRELRNFRPDTTGEMFAQWDVDGSGELEQEELMSAVREILANEAATDDR